MNTDMDDAIMKDVDKWFTQPFWTERMTKRFKRTFYGPDDRDAFLVAFVLEKMKRLDKQQFTFTEIDSLKRDVKELCKDFIQMKEDKQDTFTEIESLKQDIERMKSQLTKLSYENKQLICCCQS
jgi:septal ring factor EnvC (AmiA/AmiB activator)